MKTKTRGALLNAILIVASYGPSLAEEPAPQIRQFDVATIEKLGQDMYVQDQEAWKATDVLRAQYSEDQLKAQKLHGWITEQVGAHDTVRFIHDGPAGPEILCDVSFQDGSPGASCFAPQSAALSADEMAQYSARILAGQSVDRRCSEKYNSVALKDPQADRWLVWALASTTEPGVIVYGGHYRFTISKDGKTVIQKDALSRGCMNMAPPDASKGDPKAAFFTQLVSNVPVETVVWLNLQHKLRFYLLTPDRNMWVIDDGKISLHGMVPEKPSSASSSPQP